MKKQVLGSKVAYYSEAIEDINLFMKTLNEVNFDWNPWTASNDKNFIYGETKPFDIGQIQALEGPTKNKMVYLYTTVMDAFTKVSKDYAAGLGDYDIPRLFPVFNIKKYHENIGMGAHYDQLDGDTTLRYSLVMYLNDDCEGGEISFKLSEYTDKKPSINLDYDVAKERGEFDFGIKPEAGSVVIFPSSAPYYHVAHLVKRGFKYMVPGHWIHNDMQMRGGSM